MKTQGKGTTVIISSSIGLVGHPRAAAYAVSKPGINGLARAMALGQASDNVRINAVGPGHDATDMTAEMRTIPERRDYLLNGIPMDPLASRWRSPTSNFFRCLMRHPSSPARWSVPTADTQRNSLSQQP